MTPSEIVETRFYLRRIQRERQLVQQKCESKQAWASRNLAERAIHRKQKKQGVEPFRCDICNLWHIGAWHARRRP